MVPEDNARLYYIDMGDIRFTVLVEIKSSGQTPLLQALKRNQKRAWSLQRV